MKKIITYITAGFFGLLMITVYAAPPPVTVKKQMLYCPQPQELTSDGPWWYVGTIWKSYSRSFVEHIQSFSGAQWLGVKVGKIICLYKGKEKFTFPVALETVHPVLVPMPTGENWITTKEGYKTCLSDNVKDCPFTQQKRTDVSNIYEQIKYQAQSQNEE